MAALARQVTPQLVDDPTSKTAPIRTALRQERMRSCLRRRSEALSPQADMVLASHVRRESGRLCPTLSKQYLTLCCRATGESDVVMATLCPVTTTGYIARRIVRGCVWIHEPFQQPQNQLRGAARIYSLQSNSLISPALECWVQTRTCTVSTLSKVAHSTFFLVPG